MEKITNDIKIRKIIKEYFNTDPILLDFMNLTTITFTETVDTVGMDIISNTNPIFKINPIFFESLSEKQAEIIVSSELLKLMLGHMNRSSKFLKSYSVLSSNLTVNSTTIIEKMLAEYMKKIKYPKPEDFQFDNHENLEYYYNRLLEMFPPENQEQNGVGQNQEQNGGDQKQEQNGGGQNQEQNGGDQKQEQNGGGQNKNSIEEYYNPNNQSYSDGWGENKLLEAEIQDIIENNKNNIKKWGKYTSDLIEDVLAAFAPPQIGYKQLLSMFKSSIIKNIKTSSRKKINRRYGLIFPGKKNDTKQNIIFATDVSGSISDVDISEAFGVINKLFSLNCNIEYITFDTEIKNKEIVKKKINKKSVSGRGGTDFNEVIQYSNKKKTDGLIIFSDGYADTPKYISKSKTCWLIKNNKSFSSNFGKVIHYQSDSK